MHVDEEFSQRLEGLRAEVARLATEASAQSDTRAHVEAICERSKELLDAVRVETSLTVKMRVTVAVERLLRFAREFRAQRRDDNATMLLVASSASRECYQHVMQAARAFGAKPIERWPEPAVLLEPMQSPATFVRDSVTQAFGIRGLAGDPLPFPVVLVPWYPLGALGALCLVHHEVGHNIDQDLSIGASLKVELERRLMGADVTPPEVDIWLGWQREIIADAFGAMLGGIAFAVELAGWASAFKGADAKLTKTHPLPSLRVELACELLRLLGVTIGPQIAELLDVPESTGIAKRFGSHVRAVAEAIHQAPLTVLGGVSMTSLAPDVVDDHARVWKAANALVTGAPNDWKALPFRLIPPVARLAVSLGANADQVASKLTAPDVIAGRGAVSIPFNEARWRTATERDSVPPILDEENDGLKLPPPQLFETVDTVTFVGATNDGLPKLFEDYRGNPRKRRIEVFFLRAETLAGLEGGGRTRADNEKLRLAGRDGLKPELLDEIADDWAIYEHGEPFMFAAYFDADAPGGRIHVSAHGWGQDIKHAPSHDYMWPRTADAPERTYRYYLDALASLRSRATPIASK